MKILNDLFYSKFHEWIKFDGESAVVGLTDYAQSALGDIVFVNLPEIGDEVGVDGSFADVESVKAVSDIYTPVGGRVSAINEELLDAPEKINQDAYDAWLVKFDKITEKGELLSAEEYKAFVESIQEEA
ncbi:glycine cleavage system protein GcvH [Anaerotignum propionicum]|uniref:glycine cleavage system protein GcvH n=1 Tax=Anaerotignum propionicum TaxID=28446 RepID=UPI00210B8800|nr:glycine cleavage system protein GcvH [Anaerotignum propionicum]MCQ4935263.1 glycine cleavage system protein GcvH [Anaerotignum propionicum]